MTMKNYAITRIKKHASVKSATYLINHHLRLAEVHNADLNRKQKNEVIHRLDDIQKFLNEVPKGTKSNACRFVDVLFTASRFDTKQQFEEWKKSTWEFAKQQFGEENIALAVVHNDETTPHFHLMFKPVNPKTGKLGAGHWFDGRKKMQQYQDAYHRSVAHLGFDRGEPGSRARHKTIRQFYRDVSIAQEEIKTFSKAFNEIDQQLKNVSLWDRIKPSNLQKKIKVQLVTAYKSASKILLFKQVLQTEKVTEQNKQLLKQIDTLKDKLELATGYENPSYVQVQQFTDNYKKLESSHQQVELAKQQKREATTSPQETAFRRPDQFKP